MFDDNSFGESFSRDSFLFVVVDIVASVWRRFIVSLENRGTEVKPERRRRLV